MKELEKVKDIYLEKYDVHVNPYMTIQQEQATVNLMLEEDDEFARKIALMNSVVAFCTDIPTDQGIDLNDVIMSGLWEEITHICVNPIHEIEWTIKKYDSMDYAFSKLLNKLSDNIENFTSALPSVEDLVRNMVENQEKNDKE